MKKVMVWLLVFSMLCSMLPLTHAHAAVTDPCGSGCTLLQTVESSTTSNLKIMVYYYNCGVHVKQYDNGVLTQEAILEYASSNLTENIYINEELSNSGTYIVKYEPTDYSSSLATTMDIGAEMDADGYTFRKTGGRWSAAPNFYCDLYVKEWDGIEHIYTAFAWDELAVDTFSGFISLVLGGLKEKLKGEKPKDVLDFLMSSKSFIDKLLGNESEFWYEHYNLKEDCRGVVEGVFVAEVPYRYAKYRILGSGTDKTEEVITQNGVYYINNAEDFMSQCIGTYFNEYHYPLYANEGCNGYCNICGGTAHKTAHPSFTTATCTTASVCTQCGYERIPELGHDFLPATCTTASTCSRCGNTTGGILGHDYVEATCTSSRFCQTCGDVESGPIAHDYTYATCTEPEICRDCDAIGNPALGHNYSPATCTDPEKCGRCDAVGDDALGHDYAAATCTKPKTCSRCQRTSGSILDHNYTEATCTEPKTCPDCGATSGEPLGHDYAAATCTKPKTCKRCGATSGEELGHSYSEAECTKPPICVRCGKVNGTALGHNMSQATCTKPLTCIRCGWTTGAALGHNYSAATCINPKKCTRCGGTSGAPLGHSYGNNWSYLNTTYHVKYCTRSGCNWAYKQAHTVYGSTCTTCGCGGPFTTAGITALEVECILTPEEVLMYERARGEKN